MIEILDIVQINTNFSIQQQVALFSKIYVFLDTSNCV